MAKQVTVKEKEGCFKQPFKIIAINFSKRLNQEVITFNSIGLGFCITKPVVELSSDPRLIANFVGKDLEMINYLAKQYAQSKQEEK